MFYLNTNKPHDSIFCRVLVILETCRSFWRGGGVCTLCTLPLDLFWYSGSKFQANIRDFITNLVY